MIAEHERVALLRDVPEQGLEAGDVGTVVHVYKGGKAFEVEFVALSGQTVLVATLPAASVRSVTNREIPHARAFAAV